MSKLPKQILSEKEVIILRNCDGSYFKLDDNDLDSDLGTYLERDLNGENFQIEYSLQSSFLSTTSLLQREIFDDTEESPAGCQQTV
jgi:hypothetical protein